ncbi:hypothetical protein PM023_16205 [Halorubrum ezzemoulense]|uniref:hypothetical protein n=1 Tax=Halorubrum ezzemoulense TaxID=337243 RepID=UPI002330BB5C|nr:hypothetical protein [Halorubrum ezzemoulense]MDB2226190.1 hypothetical protein [Halorubrum ezzemoulense]
MDIDALTDDDRKQLAKDLAAELDTGLYGNRAVLSRRQLLTLAGGSAGVAGLVALGVDPATAQSAAGQVGTQSSPEDVFAFDLDVQGTLQRDLDAGGQAISNVGSVSTAQEHRTSDSPILIGSDGRREDFEGADPDARMDAALSAATDGDLIIAENGAYSTDRIISDRIRLLGSGGFEGYGSSVAGVWTFDVAVTVDNMHLQADSSAEFVLNGSAGRLINVAGPSSQMPISVSGDNNTIVGCRGLDVTFESGADGNVIGLCATTNATDVSGSNYIGPSIN